MKAHQRHRGDSMLSPRYAGPEPPPGPSESPPGLSEPYIRGAPQGGLRPPWGAACWGASDGRGGSSGGPGGGSETVFGTDVRNRCSEQTVFGTVFRAN